MERREFLRRAAAVTSVVATARVAGFDVTDALAATPTRDPSIVGSWGGLIVPETGA